MFSEYIFTLSSTAELIGLCSQPQSIQKNKKAKNLRPEKKSTKTILAGNAWSYLCESFSFGI